MIKGIGYRFCDLIFAQPSFLRLELNLDLKLFWRMER
jgi:hypothetical protein